MSQNMGDQPSHTQKRHRPDALSLALVLLVALSAVACDDDEARFDATIDAPLECLADRFPFEPTFFAASRTATGGLLRMQASILTRTRIDAFNIAIYSEPNPYGESECPSLDALSGGTFEVGPAACIQAYFRFNDECGREFVNPHVVGTVTFDSLGFEEGDLIEGVIDGSISDVVLLEQTGEPELVMTPLGQVSGEFSFEVRVGPAYQVYDLPDRHIIDEPF